MDMNRSSSRMFFFPDEGGRPQDGGKPLPQVAKELGDVAYRSNKSSDTDEEFCIVGEEAGLGIMVSTLFFQKMGQRNVKLYICIPTKICRFQKILCY